MNSFEQQETELQQQLQQICSRRGRELNPTKSAEIFNKLGLLYKTKSPDKISLIQSAALLNAAIIRQPDNQKFQDNLLDHCRDVLRCVNAEQSEASLINFAKRVKTQIVEMRNDTRIKLQNIKKIPENLDDVERNSMERAYIDGIKPLQFSISNTYKRIMADISKKCIEIMGSPPCKYTLVGWGSLARNEITPYSDFEHIILLPNLHQQTNSWQNCPIREYFRWYAVLFHIIVKNLRETIIPSVAISCLNDKSTPGGDWFWDSYTTQGISIDSLKPLKTSNKPRSTELIKPVDEMVKYLDSDEDLKNGYKLSDILTRTCYVDGDEMIYDEFCRRVKSTLKRNQSNLINVRSQLDEDLKNFELWKNAATTFELERTVDVKRVIYRSITLFISALGRLNDVDENSCFEIIDKFQSRQEINDVSAHRLSHSVAVACHIRLLHYMAKKSHDDIIDRTHSYDPIKLKIADFSRAVNKRCLINCLATADTLQIMMKNSNNISKLDSFFQEWYFAVSQSSAYHFLGLDNEGLLVAKQNLADVISVNHPSFLYGCRNRSAMYMASGQYKNCLALNSKIKKHINTNGRYESLQHDLIGLELKCLLLLGRFSQLKNKTDALLKTKSNPDAIHLYPYLLYNGASNFHLQKYYEALSAFRDARKCATKNIFHHKCTEVTALVTSFVSECLIKIGRTQQGLHVAREGYNLAFDHGSTCLVYLFTLRIDKSKSFKAKQKSHFLTWLASFTKSVKNDFPAANWYNI